MERANTEKSDLFFEKTSQQWKTKTNVVLHSFTSNVFTKPLKVRFDSLIYELDLVSFST